MDVKKRSVIALVVVALGLVGAIAFALFSTAEKVQPHFRDSEERRNYESAIMEAPGRVEADFGTIADDATGKLYTAYITDRALCDRRCMTVAQVDGGYAVTLPVSYSYTPGTKSFTAPYTRGNIVSLTYWDPAAHQSRTITVPSGETVSVPEVLRSRKLDSMRRGETMYATPYMVRRGTDERLRVLADIPVFYEPGGSDYGRAELARLTRTSDGFVACLPASYEPLPDETMNSPYTVTLEVGC